MFTTCLKRWASRKQQKWEKMIIKYYVLLTAHCIFLYMFWKVYSPIPWLWPIIVFRGKYCWFFCAMLLNLNCSKLSSDVVKCNRLWETLNKTLYLQSKTASPFLHSHTFIEHSENQTSHNTACFMKCEI